MVLRVLEALVPGGQAWGHSGGGGVQRIKPRAGLGPAQPPPVGQLCLSNGNNGTRGPLRGGWVMMNSWAEASPGHRCGWAPGLFGRC